MKHWPGRVPTGKGTSDEFVRNEIDHFTLARMQTESLTPNPAADRVTLIRRLSFDLIGLPPNPGEVKAFVNDSPSDSKAWTSG